MFSPLLARLTGRRMRVLATGAVTALALAVPGVASADSTTAPVAVPSAAAPAWTGSWSAIVVPGLGAPVAPDDTGSWS